MPINIDSRDFVLPGNDRVLGALSDFAVNQRRDKELAREQKRQQQQDKFRTAELIKDSFEPAKLLTGQKEIDAKINEDLNMGLQKVLQKASQNGYDPLASLNDIRNVISGPAQLSQKVKNIKASNKQYIDAVSKMYPDVDVAALQDIAEKNAFLTKDPITGRQTYKPIDQIDESKQYIGEILDNMPEEVLKGNSGFMSNIEKNFKPSKVSSDDTEGQFRGAKQRYKWSADVNNFQELYTDKNGQVSGVRTKAEKAKVFGKDENVLPEKEFNGLMEDDNSRMVINARANKLLKSQGKTINPLSSEYQLAKRKAAYDLLEEHVPKNFHPVESNIKAPVTNIYLKNTDSEGVNKINLDEYSEVGGKKDITPIFDSIVTGKDEYGHGILMKDVLFDPETKKISYNGNPPVSIAKFIQDNRLQGKELKIAQSLEKYRSSNKKAESPAASPAAEGGGAWYERLARRGKNAVNAAANAISGKSTPPVKKAEDLRKKYNY